jgi:hypothetical protein
MEYHSDRFQDHSLMLFKETVLVACVPAHIKNGGWYSHRGLTYGGVIVHPEFPADQLPEILQSIENHLSQMGGIDTIEYNLSPFFYNPLHDQMLAGLHHQGFKTSRAHRSMHVMLQEDWSVSSKKTAGYRNGKFDALQFEISDAITPFYEQVLVPSLQSRHESAPVHTLAELLLLQSRFPQQVEVHQVFSNGVLVAGVLYFIKDAVVKSQYAASTALGFQQRAMDFLYIESMKNFKSREKTILDFGTVNHADDSIIVGLDRFKRELGAVGSPMLRFSKTL